FARPRRARPRRRRLRPQAHRGYLEARLGRLRGPGNQGAHAGLWRAPQGLPDRDARGALARPRHCRGPQGAADPRRSRAGAAHDDLLLGALPGRGRQGDHQGRGRLERGLGRRRADPLHPLRGRPSAHREPAHAAPQPRRQGRARDRHLAARRMSKDKSAPTPSQIARRRMPRLVRVVRARPRLFLATALGIVVALVLPSDWRATTRALVGWDVGVAVYLAFAYAAMAKADVARIRRRAALLDEDRTVFLTLTAGAALASLGAIVAELGVKETGRGP